jgi:hypothetical protein
VLLCGAKSSLKTQVLNVKLEEIVGGAMGILGVLNDVANEKVAAKLSHWRD